MSIPFPALSKRLAHYRWRLHLSQEQLAALSGVSYGEIQAIEQSKRTDPRLSIVIKLSQALGITLMGLITEPPTASQVPLKANDTNINGCWPGDMHLSQEPRPCPNLAVERTSAA